VGLETLEPRVALSLGAEFQVNSVIGTDQLESDNASSASGRSVVVWTDKVSNTTTAIRAQRYLNGVADGPEITVDVSNKPEGQPAVAMDVLGNFVVAWARTQNPGDSDVLARRFNATGTALGSVLTVAGGANFDQFDPDVAMSAQGNFVVSHTSDETLELSDGHFVTLESVEAQRFFSNGTPNGSQLTIDLNASHSSVASAPDGRFAVAYERAVSGTNTDVKLARFSAAGASLGTLTIAGSTSLREGAPSLATDNFGNAVVAYHQRLNTNFNFDVKARQVSNAGVLGSILNIANGGIQERNPSVALHPTNGKFVVAYETQGVNQGVSVTEMSAAGTVLATLSVGSARSDPAISIDGSGNYLVSYTAGSTPPRGIRARRGLL
jgi:hypothetical protein